MEAIYKNSIYPISLIQKSFDDQKHLMFMLSNVFDPRYAFLIFSPLIFSLDRVTGRKLMWVTVIAEWSNQILKWLMRGERPYWWVHEFESKASSGLSSSNQLPGLKQTFMTCETGPGSPSGHAMVTAAVWYILVEALLAKTNSWRQNGKLPAAASKPLFNSACWAVYTFGLCCVSLSRIYLAAHFPHQCLLGAGMGVAVAMLVSSLYAATEKLSLRAYFLGTLAMFASALVTYGTLLYVFGFNPLWSVERALKWCAKREHVHLDTTPFFSMMRYTGFFLGMGLGLHSPLVKATVPSAASFSTAAKLTTAALSVAASKAIEAIPISKETLHVNTIYGIVFLESLLLPYLFIAVIPFVVSKFTSSSNSSMAKKIAASQDDNNNIHLLKAQ